MKEAGDEGRQEGRKVGSTKRTYIKGQGELKEERSKLEVLKQIADTQI